MTTGLATAAMAMPALAQELRPWTGGYAGIGVGLDFPRDDREVSALRDNDLDKLFADTHRTTFGAIACSHRAASDQTGCHRDGERSGYGGHVGYDVQFGDVVVGAVAELGRSNIGRRSGGDATMQQRIARSMDWNTQGRLRAGYALGSTLPYVTGGAVLARIDRGPAANAVDGFAADRNRSNGLGWTAGGGVDQLVSERFSIGVLYTFASVTERSRGQVERLPFTGNADRRFDWHSARVRANFRF
ncbi:outer membrane beta-barrel protein [uncultured Sphingomonas sp.]|nr:outer membrane beta-barrel protein [uncultured Sphingomonas sp.]